MTAIETITKAAHLIDMNDIILSKDKDASIKYNHRINLEQFVMERRTKDND